MSDSTKLTKEEVDALEDGVMDLMMAFTLQPNGTKALRQLCQKQVDLQARIAELEAVVNHEQMCNSQLQIKLANCEIGRAHAYDDQDIAIQRCNRMQARISELNGDKASLNMTCNIQSNQLAEKDRVIEVLVDRQIRDRLCPNVMIFSECDHKAVSCTECWEEWAKTEATKNKENKI